MSGTLLTDRYLWFDGHCTLAPDGLADLILKGNKLDKRFHVTKLTDEIVAFNRFSEFQLDVKEEVGAIHAKWLTPAPYDTLDVTAWVTDRLKEQKSKFSKDEYALRQARISEEMNLFEEFGLIPLVRLLVYIIETFRRTNTVWGVGRGSSCASYILYLIGVHDVDSVRYELDINEFLR